MKRTFLLLILIGLAGLLSNTLQANNLDQGTFPPNGPQGLIYQQSTPPDPAEEEPESKDSIQTETPLESFFNGVLEWFYEPETPAKQQTERTTQKRSQQQGRTTQKQKVSIWQ